MRGSQDRAGCAARLVRPVGRPVARASGLSIHLGQLAGIGPPRTGRVAACGTCVGIAHGRPPPVCRAARHARATASIAQPAHNPSRRSAALLLTSDKTAATLLSMDYKTLVVVLLLAAGSVHAQTPEARERLLVQPAWVAQHLQDQDLVLLHVGPRPSTTPDTSRARAISTTRTWPSPIDARRAHAADAAPRGFAAAARGGRDLERVTHRRVLRSARTRSVSPTARVMFTLDYAGLGDRASVLDGGLEAWVKAGHPLSTDVPADRPGTLAPLSVRPLIVDAEFVKANLATASIAIVDRTERGLLRWHPDRRGGERAAHDWPHPGCRERPVQRHHRFGEPPEACRRVAGAVREGGCAAGRHGRGLLPHRATGDAGHPCCTHARIQGPAV